MSMIVIKMQQHQMDEMGECIEQGLQCFGRAMSIYSEMKHAGEQGGMMGERRMGMREPEYDDYPRMGMREGMGHGYMGERRGGRYGY